jgi:non-ribosomal peptide synthetase component F
MMRSPVSCHHPESYGPAIYHGQPERHAESAIAGSLNEPLRVARPMPMFPPEVYRSYLTPLRFLQRSASVFRQKPAVVYGDRVWTYPDLNERVHRLASALTAAGVRPGDRVAYLVPTSRRCWRGTSGCHWPAQSWWRSTRVSPRGGCLHPGAFRRRQRSWWTPSWRTSSSRAAADLPS